MQAIDWSGVFPAATTQFAPDLALDLTATARVQRALFEDGVDGMIVIGTVGENNSLEPEEKLSVVDSAVRMAGGARPVLAGVSELTTRRAVAFAQNAEKLGVSGLMVLPAMVYVPSEAELVAHFRSVAEATRLPIMLYNNPPAYRVDISFDALEKLADLPNVAAIKESAPDPRRITDLINRFGDRFTIFSGLDDIALEGLLLGAKGWVSGLTNVFPRESLALVAAARRGDLATARRIYRWFMPLLHLDAGHDLVQAIKFAEEIMDRGSERVRMPRMILSGARRDYVRRLVETAAATRPALDLAA